METPSGGIDIRGLRGSRPRTSRPTVLATAREPSADTESALVGSSSAMQGLRAKVALVASARRTTLVAGPTGSGKEVVASALHRSSTRTSQPFVSVHCAALPESLVEAELFGHARGAFTGAVEHRAGLVRTASHGTLFLDEIDSLSLATQAKLLRFLELGEYRAVGSDRTERSDAWVVAATNQDLQARVDRGAFRADLLYRLDVVRIDVPSLRERGAGDVLELATHFLRRVERARGDDLWLDQGARSVLASHDWPGNVRELKNRIESAGLLGPSGRIDATRLGLPVARRTSSAPPSALSPPPAAVDLAPEVGRSLDGMLWELVASRGLSLAEAVTECERSLIRAALTAASENRSRAAALLGIHVRTIYKKLDAG